MIDWEITEEITGFDEEYFKKYPKSNIKVAAICDGEYCGHKLRWLEFCSYSDLCRLCTTKSDATRKKLSDAANKRYEDPKEHDKTSEALKNFWCDPENCKKMYDAQLKRCEARILYLREDY